MGMFSMSKGEGLSEGREIVKTKPAPVVPYYEEPKPKTDEEIEQELDWLLEAAGMSRESLARASEIR